MSNQLKWRYIFNKSLSKLVFVPLVLVSLVIDAQPTAYSEDKIIFDEKNSPENKWLGRWQATDTLFEINLKSSGGIFKIEKINSMGFDWISNSVTLEGKNLKLAIEYGGAKGMIIAKITSPSQQYAIASVETCEPVYMVICALSKNRRIRFQRLK